MNIDVCMPTWNSAELLGGTLDFLSIAEASSQVVVNQLIVVDNDSDDETLDIAEQKAEKSDWKRNLISTRSSLPEARKIAIKNVETDWFLFLDDDVRISKTYLTNLSEATAPIIGAIQGRKESRTESNSDWVRRRGRRAGTHATLIRHDAVAGIQYPDDLYVLEDEYTRRFVDNSEYLWIFNHQARFTHASTERHQIGWQEGYLGGKYGLSKFHNVALNVPYAAFTRRNPSPHVKRMVGWVWGYVQKTDGKL
jgi:glycosyltransferase involved in cell wall biosynthesis